MGRVAEPARHLPGYLPPGRLHAYLHGVAVEVMACSDNVLRGGLTSKHVDVAELLAAAELRAGPAAVITPHTDRSGWGRCPVPHRQLRAGPDPARRGRADPLVHEALVLEVLRGDVLGELTVDVD